MPVLTKYLLKWNIISLKTHKPMLYLKELTNKIIEERKSKNIVGNQSIFYHKIQQIY